MRWGEGQGGCHSFLMNNNPRGEFLRQTYKSMSFHLLLMSISEFCHAETF